MKRRALLIVSVLIMIFVCGCTATMVQKEFVAVGGSRADGVVELSCEPFHSFETPILDETQGLRVAEKRCAAWGYAGAEPFAGPKRQYSDYIRIRCARWFQCTEPMPVDAPPSNKKK